MSYQLEFPALYAVTKMNQQLIRLVGSNLTHYSVDVRIDYERWICFETEYGEWSRVSSNDFKLNQDQEAN
jgi:hypothetical protein